jgi:mono/diheme cytochrome c family protein
MIEQYVNTEELKRLLSTLLVVLGALVIAGLFASILVPGLRNANRPPAPTPVNAVVGEPGWLDPTEFPPQMGKDVPPVDAKSLISYSPKLVAQGKELFTKNCVQCHGELGRGDGPASSTMNPRPRNFSSPDGWKNGHDLPSVYKTVSQGLQGSGMAAFDYLTKTERMALAQYVQSLGQFEHGSGSAEAAEILTKELSAPGGRTPNKIPVSLAMVKLEQEYKVAPRMRLDPEDHSPGAELVRRVVSDPSRAAVSLAGAQSWRTGPNVLAATILAGAPANGFSISAAALSAAEWQVLHSELAGRIGR